jgi:hypothetical protein
MLKKFCLSLWQPLVAGPSQTLAASCFEHGTLGRLLLGLARATHRIDVRNHHLPPHPVAPGSLRGECIRFQHLIALRSSDLRHPGLAILRTTPSSHVQAAVNAFYPYPFVNITKLGFATVAVNGVGAVLLPFAVGSLYLLLENLTARGHATKHVDALLAR